jgi:hypothetical protein
MRNPNDCVPRSSADLDLTHFDATSKTLARLGEAADEMKEVFPLSVVVCRRYWDFVHVRIRLI